MTVVVYRGQSQPVSVNEQQATNPALFSKKTPTPPTEGGNTFLPAVVAGEESGLGTTQQPGGHVYWVQ